MPMFADSLRGLAAAAIVSALVILGLVYGRDILLPFALAIVLAFIMAPVVGRLNLIGLPQGAAAALAVAAVIGAVIVASISFSNQLLYATTELAQKKENVLGKIRWLSGKSGGDGVLQKASKSIEMLGKDLKREIQGAETNGKAPVVVMKDSAEADVLSWSSLQVALHPLALAGLTLLFTVFLLGQYQDIRDRVVRVAGTDNMGRTAAALSDAGARLSDMFTMQAALNVAFGAVVAAALAIIGVPSPVVWGAATAVLRFVPFIGSFLAAVPPIVLAAAGEPGWGMVVATAGLFAIGEPIMGHVVEPLVLGKRSGLSPLAFVMAASFWTLVWGPFGLILAAPLTMTIVVLGQYIPQFEFASILLGDAPSLSPEQEFYHRLLSGDTVSAYAQTDLLEHDGRAAFVDTVVMPALAIAAKDLRSDRINDKQTIAIGRALEDFGDLYLDDIGNELVSADQKADAIDGGATLIVPGRGAIDQYAAAFVARYLSKATGRAVGASERSSGLLALATAREAPAEDTPSRLIILTVGGLDGSHVQHIERRAQRDFPGARVATFLMEDGGAVRVQPASAGVRCRDIREAGQFVVTHVVATDAMAVAKGNETATTSLSVISGDAA